MNDYSGGDDRCLQLLDLMQKEDFLVKRVEETDQFFEDGEQIELSLGPPGLKNWDIKEKSHGSVNSFCDISPWGHHNKVPFVSLEPTHQPSEENLIIVKKESSSSALEMLTAEKRGFSANTAVPNNDSAKRTAPISAVGWPPVCSFRKNLASIGSSKSALDSPNESSNKTFLQKPIANCSKNLLVKINMDGVPIGRKADLKLHNSYEKLSCAVDELFRDLLAVQEDLFSGGINGEKVSGGLLNGSGEYTLVYEDNEGDRMLVGDVPWNVFVSSVKRLRVLKSSELPNLICGSKALR